MPQTQTERFVCLKASGSRFAYVNDTQAGCTVKRYDVLKPNGWERAERHAKSLNVAEMFRKIGRAALPPIQTARSHNAKDHRVYI